MPDTPSSIRSPKFITLPHVKHSFQGRRPGGLEGAIVHYDAGRTRPLNGADDPHFGARTTMESGMASGFAFISIARDGTVMLPANMDWEQWGSHAGRSLCPVTKRKGVSQYYVGIEVNSPGMVFPTMDADVFVPWFDAVRGAKGQVVLDAQGRARVKNPNGELYRAAQVRVVAAPVRNIRRGVYTCFTSVQFGALFELLRWLKARFPASFRMDRVFGHDEVATPSGRKTDPGGSMGMATGGAVMPMAHFRRLMGA